MTEQQNLYFILQKRKGYGKCNGLGALFVSTIDSVLDTKPAPYRILHQTPNSDVYYGKTVFRKHVKCYCFKRLTKCWYSFYRNSMFVNFKRNSARMGMVAEEFGYANII